MKPVPVRIGAYGVLVRDQQILLCHTISGPRTILNFPGGAIERSETAEQCVIREFYEETGLDVSILLHLHSTGDHFMNPDFPLTRMQAHYFLVNAPATLEIATNSSDVTGTRWLFLTDLPHPEMLEIDAHFCSLLPALLGKLPGVG